MTVPTFLDRRMVQLKRAHTLRSWELPSNQVCSSSLHLRKLVRPEMRFVNFRYPLYNLPYVEQ